MKSAWAAVLLTAALAAGACGSDPDTAEQETAATASPTPPPESAASPTPEPTASPTPPPEPTPALPVELAPGEVPRILTLGDSIAVQVVPHLRETLGGEAALLDFTFGGLAPCDSFVILESEEVAEFDPHVVVFDFGGNALTPCMHDEVGERYAGEAYALKIDADTRRAIGLAKGLDARVLLIDQPAGRGDAHSGTSATFRAIADENEDGTVRFLSMWPVLTPNGFQQSDTCQPEEPGCVNGTGELRSPPPGGHLEPLGAWRYAVAIHDELDRLGWLGR